jgi:sporulation protein YlmC with PRC-barrel domain
MDPKLGRSITLAVACACFALFGTALAQEKKDTQQQNQQQSQDAKKGAASGGSSAPIAGRMKLGTTVIETEAIAKGIRASKLIGARVKNDQGERVGKIDDIIVSPDGKVTMAVLEVGGFLGIGEHRVAIPVDQFSSLGAEPVLPGASKTALKELPEFKYARA